MGIKGILIVSLDFELFWGVRDQKTIEEYKEDLLEERAAVPAILRLFAEYQIHATWAIVGLLCFDSRDELLKSLPDKTPAYFNRRLSPYQYLSQIGTSEQEDPFHLAPSLVRMIASSPHQEIGSHTFSHYYCLERGQDKETFKSDLEAASNITRRLNLPLESLIFPRNQVNSDYLAVAREMGIKAYRGVESSWIYEARNGEEETRLRRVLRFLDAYCRISGHNGHSIEKIKRAHPFNIPSSRFLRPYEKNLRILEPLRLRRIASDLTYAAERGLVYHLWWHPHNFSFHLEENILFLSKILDHYARLRERYEMESLSMGELANRLLDASDGK